ncbi:MAG: alkaline phosphatase family protein, partial [Holophagales bacterium]|nr:alkaline phosphatase family protein [Holophagales bacterium]
MSDTGRKVLLIGWDAADWKVADPLLEAGQLPNLERLIDGGVIGTLETLDPPLSPMLWTSIATGKWPFEHGIIGFSEPNPDGRGVRPVSGSSRRCESLWTIASRCGLDAHQVGWWPSHPAESIRGIAVSELFQKAPRPIYEEWPVPPGSVQPEELTAQMAALRVHPHELTAAHLLPFVPRAAELDQRRPEVRRRLEALRRTIAECATEQAVATWILEHQPWRLMAVYFDAIDHFCHGFMRFHPPRMQGVDPELFDMYRQVVATAYRFHDMMLGRLAQLAGDDAVVVLVSDHGFHPERQRPRRLPREPAGPAREHSPYGIILMHGPGIRSDELIHGAGVLDVAPTVLHLLGLPVGRDMVGKVLADAFEEPVQIAYVPTWESRADSAEPNDGRDAEADRAALAQLVDLGYIEPQAADGAAAASRVERENRFYLARSLADAGRVDDAEALARQLAQDDPQAHRYAVLLVQLRLRQRDAAGARAALQALRQQVSEETPGLLLLQALVAIEEADPPRALRYLKAAAVEAEQPEIHIRLGQVHRFLGDEVAAAAAYSRALEMDPQQPEALRGQGELALGAGEPQVAAELLMASIGLRYHQPAVHFYL